METCRICNEKFKTLRGLVSHVYAKHELTSKNYYDKYLKKSKDGECVVCGNETTYRNMGDGYLKTCSIECRNNNKDIKRDYWRGKKQSIEIINKRVDNTNQEQKEIKRKQTMLRKYGVDNPSKLDFVKNKISISNKGKTQNRTIKWQNKIIETKRKNGTLKHSEETKNKISKKLNQYFSENLDREKYISDSNNINHISGWYNGLYFRSSLELSFLVNNSGKLFYSCESNKYKVIYVDNGKNRVYYPDFTDGEFIYEIKPIKLLGLYNNDIKIKEATKVYGDKYKVITELESPYIPKKKIFELIDCKAIILTERSKKVLDKYRF